MCRQSAVRSRRLVSFTLVVVGVSLSGVTPMAARPIAADPGPAGDSTTTLPVIDTTPPTPEPVPATPPPTTPPPPAPVPEATPVIKGIVGRLTRSAQDAQRVVDDIHVLQQQIQLQIAGLSAQIGELDAKIADLGSQIRETEASIHATHDALNSVVVNEYQHLGTATKIPGSDSTADHVRKEKYGRAVTQHQIAVISELEAHRDQLRATEAETRSQRSQLESERQLAERSADDAARRTTEAERAASDAGAVLARWNTIKDGIGTPIMGQSTLSANELTRWFVSTHRRANTTVAIGELARYYIEEGSAEGVRGDIALAQAILETGSFGFPGGGQLAGADNNFAGIGACDSCDHGYTFPDARIGVRAQVQLLRSYADASVNVFTLANPSAMPNFDSFGRHGFAPTWGDLTHRWATADGYGDKIMFLYVEILKFATGVR